MKLLGIDGRTFGGWVLVASGLLGACTTSAHATGAGAGATVPPASTPTFHVQVGATTTAVSGGAAGYGIVATGTNTFRVVWTGQGGANGGYHEFYGSMWTRGHFSGQVLGCTGGTCALEGDDFVSQPYDTYGGARIDWDTFASDSVDGFEVTADTLPVYFQVYVDGQLYPDLVFFPDATNAGQTSSVTTIPFGITTP